jgi:hypothetical protein
MLCRDDISKLWELRDDRYAVMCVKHKNYETKDDIKYLNSPQYSFDKKNWASVMLFNNEKCQALTPEYINDGSVTKMDLHQFKWLGDDSLIGSLPKRWNHLVGEECYDEDAAIAHFTIGGPYFEEYDCCDYSDEWFDEKERMKKCLQR